MRFTIEHHPEGTIRYKRRFAFWPRLIGLQRVWLEHYVVKQVWSRTIECSQIGEYNQYSFYSKLKWVDVKEMLSDDLEISPLEKALR